jgi:glycosyltransferase-like protein
LSGQRVRVAVVHHLSTPRGSVTVCAQVVKGLNARGIDAKFFTLTGDVTSEYLQGVPHAFVGRARTRPSYKDQLVDSADALAQHLGPHLSGRYDIIHIHDVIDHAALARIRHQIGGALVVRTVHHLYERPDHWLRELQDRSVVEADHLVTVSDYWRTRVSDQYRREPTVIRNGVDASRFARVSSSVDRRQKKDDDPFLFLTVGGISPRKGTLELIRAFAILNKERSPGRRPARLVIVGGHSPNPYSEYRAAVSEELGRLGLVSGEDVAFPGTLTADELIAAYHTADAFVFPSHAEGWGLAALEAMAAGLPVVMSDLGVFREYASPDDVLFVKPGDVPGLAAAMQLVAASPERRAALSARGVALAAKYSWQTTANDHADLYLKLLTNRG